MNTSAHTPFLRLVAQAFVNKYADKLHNFCFVFPNRRSSVFFIEDLSQIAGRTMLSPCVTSITDFLTELTGSVEPSKIEQLFILYQEYQLIMGDRAEPFDRFSYWGDVILNDFNDVDKYLADPQKIFKNIRDLKKIRSNFLTPEQVKVIEDYFGTTYTHQIADDNRFWSDPSVYGTKSTDRFTEIWDALNPLYVNFNKRLSEQHLSYSGRIYREAVNRVTQMGAEDFPFSKYVFVGFNVLSLSEIKIFKALGDKGIADYYWDCNSPALTHEANKASWFISRNIKMFPSKLDLGETKITEFCPIDVIGIPSNIGQAKYTSKVIDSLIDSGAITDTDNAINTAIVLPDEALFMPILDSLNDRITGVNITMGYPLRLSDIAVLVNRIARLHKQSRKHKDDFIFFHEDVKDLISHPFMQLINEQQCASLSKFMAVSGKFYISYSEINEQLRQCQTDNDSVSIELIFKPIPSSYTSEMLVTFLNRIVRFIEAGLIAQGKVQAQSVAMGMISKFMDSLTNLSGTISKYNIPMNENTFFYLVSRMVSSVSIAFEGEPLHGLQIMGVLETRCLDFDNVIILSMNERVFPRKHFSRSFIPANLRRGFGMATVEFQDCMYAYYFFRLISRAKHVTLLYDARRQSIGSGEYSRYIEQLRILYPDAKLNLKVLDFSINAPADLDVSVTKTDRIMQLIKRYTVPGSGHFLSASSLNHYINCPLSFYFEKVENLNIADDVSEFMDASTLGTIVHDVMKDLYPRNKVITPDLITKLEPNIDGLIKRYIAKHYTHDPNAAPNGETIIVGNAIRFFIKSILNYDKSLGKFRIIQCEEEQKVHWNGINIRQYIDRVDAVIDDNGNEHLRIVDYKTGSDLTKASSFNNIFSDNSGKRRKAMFQLLLYCNVYAHDKGLGSKPIQPVIYKVNKMKESGFSINKMPVTDYLTHPITSSAKLNDMFISGFNGIINELLDPNQPFKQTPTPSNCAYCKYAPFCHR
ncbi:MAG: PD-(D/E)XK nuclease family protein [Muribaculaceae bacterium]